MQSPAYNQEMQANSDFDMCDGVKMVCPLCHLLSLVINLVATAGDKC